MNTPTAIFLGLPLIAAAIFFRGPMMPAHAAFVGADGIGCGGKRNVFCVLDGSKVHLTQPRSGIFWTWDWRTGEVLKSPNK